MEVTVKKNGQMGPCVTITAGQGQSSDIQVVKEDSTIASKSSEMRASDTDELVRTQSNISEASSLTRLTTEPVHEDNLQYFERHGLGRAVDSTKKNPWKSRKPHQIRKVEMSNIVENDEGNSVHRFSLQVGNYSHLQNGFESSITAPKIPVRVGVAADACRSTDSKKLVKGRSIHKRTIILMDKGQSSDLEERVREELNGKEDPVGHCSKFLQDEYGGATHFISSITLGAMEYSVEEYKETDIAGKVGGSIGVDSFVSLKSETSLELRSFEKSTFDQKVGRMNTEDEVLQEGVIQYECTSIAALVKDPDNHKHVTEAVRLYMIDKKTKKKGIRGPYLIHYKDSKVDKKYYWQVDPDKKVQVTDSEKNASRFFIERDHRGAQSEFMITTSEDGKLKSDSYPNDPLYVHLCEDTKTSGWSLIVGPIFRKKSSKSMTERFEVYDPKPGKSSLTADSRWFPASGGKEGEGRFLKPQLDWMFKQLQDRFMSPRYLHYDMSSNISLDKACLHSKRTRFFLTCCEQQK